MFIVVTLFLAILAIFALYFLFGRETALPPGPRGCPIIGNILDFVGRDLRDVFVEYRQKYGDIFTVRVFNQVFVIFNGYDVLKDVFVKQSEKFSERPTNAVMQATNTGDGFWGPPGRQLWKVNRRFCLSTLKNFGMGKNIMQIRIHEEIHYFLESIDRHDGQPFDLTSLLHKAVANVIFAIVLGKRFSYDDTLFCELTQNMHEFLNTNLAFALPFFRRLPGDPFHINRLYKNRKFLSHHIGKFIDEHNESYTKEQPENLIDAYIGQMRHPSPGIEHCDMNKNELVTTLEELLTAGFDTTANSILFGLIYMLHNQSVERKLASELDKAVSPDSLPCIDDKMKLPFMEATILEILRKSCVVPFGVPHAAARDSTLNGYCIPGGASLIVNLHSVLMDEKLWSDPESFRPARFLNDDGTVNRVKEAIPFSIGKRACIGEPIARLEMFLFFSAMLQRFEFRPVMEGELPPLDSEIAMVIAPKNFMIRAIPRKRRQ